MVTRFNPAAPLVLSAQQKAVLVGWFADQKPAMQNPTYRRLATEDQHSCQVAWDLLQYRWRGGQPDPLLVAPLAAAWSLAQMRKKLQESPQILWQGWVRQYCVEALFSPWVAKCIEANAQRAGLHVPPGRSQVEVQRLRGIWGLEDIGLATNFYAVLRMLDLNWLWNHGAGGLVDLQWFHVLLCWMHRGDYAEAPGTIPMYIERVFRSASGIPWVAGELIPYADEACTRELLSLCPKE